MRIQRAAVVCVNREPQPGERIKAGIFTQSRRPLLRAGAKRRRSPRAVSEGTGQPPKGGTQGRVSRPSHPSRGYRGGSGARAARGHRRDRGTCERRRGIGLSRGDKGGDSEGGQGDNRTSGERR